MTALLLILSTVLGAQEVASQITSPNNAGVEQGEEGIEATPAWTWSLFPGSTWLYGKPPHSECEILADGELSCHTTYAGNWQAGSAGVWNEKFGLSMPNTEDFFILNPVVGANFADFDAVFADGFMLGRPRGLDIGLDSSCDIAEDGRLSCSTLYDGSWHIGTGGDWEDTFGLMPPVEKQFYIGELDVGLGVDFGQTVYVEGSAFGPQYVINSQGSAPQDLSTTLLLLSNIMTTLSEITKTMVSKEELRLLAEKLDIHIQRFEEAMPLIPKTEE